MFHSHCETYDQHLSMKRKRNVHVCYARKEIISLLIIDYILSKLIYEANMLKVNIYARQHRVVTRGISTSKLL